MSYVDKIKKIVKDEYLDLVLSNEKLKLLALFIYMAGGGPLKKQFNDYLKHLSKSK